MDANLQMKDLLGLARRGTAWRGAAGPGTARLGAARPGLARQGAAGRGTARRGKARRGTARQGKAWDLFTSSESANTAQSRLGTRTVPHNERINCR